MCDHVDEINEARTRLLDATRATLPYEVHEAIRDSPEYVAVSLDDSTRVSYADEHCSSIYDYKRRKITTLNRYLLRRLKLDVDDRLVSKCVAAFSAGEGTFEIRGDVGEVYLEDHGPDSCMKFKPYPQWLENGPCEVLLFTRPGQEQWYARALLWHGKFIDRIYPNDEYAIEAYHEYARDNDMVMLEDNDSGSHWAGHTVSARLPIIEHGYPYMDTLSCITLEGGCEAVLSTDSGDYILDHTDGRPYLHECRDCGCQVFPDNYDPDYERCDDCYRNMSVCYRCENVMPDSDAYISAEGETLCDDCCCELEQCSQCERATMTSNETSSGECACNSCVRHLPQCCGCSLPMDEESHSLDEGNYCDYCYEKLETCCYCGTPECESFTNPTHRCGETENDTEIMSTAASA